MAGPLIVIATFAPDDFAWLEGLRRKHYPPERNRVPVHLTIFQALPPSAESEVRSRLGSLTRAKAPRAMIDGLMDLGGGVAFRVVSPEVDQIRAGMAHDLHGLLGAQDAGGWRPHITIQNKVAPKVARTLIAELSQGFQPRPVGIRGLALHRYAGGPWEPVGTYSFRA